MANSIYKISKYFKKHHPSEPYRIFVVVPFISADACRKFEQFSNVQVNTTTKMVRTVDEILTPDELKIKRFYYGYGKTVTAAEWKIPDCMSLVAHVTSFMTDFPAPYKSKK